MKFLRFGGALFLLLVILLLFAGKASAATFTVNTTNDGNDANPGNGVCEVNVGVGDCGIRALIQETNALAGADTGNFNIPGAGVHTFVPASNYPVIIDQLTIDGSTQPSASCGTLVPTNLPANNTPHTLLIEINGASAGGSALGGVLTFRPGASNSVVRGLVINRANAVSGGGDGINVGGATVSGVTAECNYLGTDPTGMVALPNKNGIAFITSANSGLIQNNLASGNTNYGINISTNSSVIVQNNIAGLNSVGTSALANGLHGLLAQTTTGTSILHNVFSGNTQFGISTQRSDSFSIRGNFVGLGVTGSPVANGSNGADLFSSSDFTVGGTAAADRNVISANAGIGLHIYNFCTDIFPTSANSATIGNYIGTTASGAVTAGYGNGGSGIQVNEYLSSCTSVTNHRFGGYAAGEPNLIAGNGDDGIRIFQAPNTDVDGISVLQNIIYANGGLGINLAFDSSDDGVADTDLGVNPNDLDDPDVTANRYLNFPVINSAKINGSNVEINYNLDINNATAANGYRVDFYLNDTSSVDPTGHGEGRYYLGSQTVAGDVTNQSVVLPSSIALNSNQTITAVTTLLQSGSGNFYGSSEFAQNVSLTASASLAPTGQSQTVGLVVAVMMLFSSGIAGYALLLRRKRFDY